MYQFELDDRQPFRNCAERGLLGSVCLLPFSLLVFSLLVFSVPSAHAHQVDWDTKPHPQLTSPNLISNSNFNGTSGWDLIGGTYDSSVSRTAGSGSISLIDTTPNDNAYTSFPSLLPVTPGETYTLSAYAMANTTNGFPSPVVRMAYNFRSNTGALLSSTPWQYTRWGSSVSGEWEEMTTTIQIPDEIGETPVALLRVQFFVSDQVNGADREVWIDDVYLGLGRGYDQPASPKTAFDGEQTRVDELGNMEVLRNGTTWEPFFPLAIYGDGDRPDWTDYSNQGFNMEMRAFSTEIVQKAADAGMLSGIDISGYVIPGFSNYNNLTRLKNFIDDLKSNGLMDDVSLFYWDNEVNYGEWDVPVAITDLIKANTVDSHGDRLLPIYTLNGNPGVARRHLTDTVNLSDITGTYIGNGLGDPLGRTDNFRNLDNVENQRQPAVFAQVNRGVGNEMRARLFGAIAHGARGMGFWSDRYGTAGQQVDNLPWWGDFPNIASEINQMMDAGLIQVPHWTEWSIGTDEDLVDFGTRDLNGEGYLIVANYNDVSTTATFTLADLGFLGCTPTEIRDFFTDTLIATLTGNQFDITLDANGSGVFRLVAPTSLGDSDEDNDVDGADFLVGQRSSSPNGDTPCDLAE